MKMIFLAMMLTVMAVYPTFAIEDDPEFQQTKKIFLQAVDQKEDAADEAAKGFEALTAKEPANPLYQCYLGASHALQGGAAWAPWNKMRLTEQGLGIVDKALASLATVNGNSQQDIHTRLETKFVAARTFVNVPDAIFHRKADGERLLAEITGSADYPKTNTEFRASVEKFVASIKK